MPLTPADRYEQGRRIGSAFFEGAAPLLERGVAVLAVRKIQEEEHKRDLRESQQSLASIARAGGFPLLADRAAAGDVFVTPDTLPGWIEGLKGRIGARREAQELQRKQGAEQRAAADRLAILGDLGLDLPSGVSGIGQQEFGELVGFLQARSAARRLAGDGGGGAPERITIESPDLARLTKERNGRRDEIGSMVGGAPEDFREAYKEATGLDIDADTVLRFVSGGGTRREFQTMLAAPGGRVLGRRDAREVERNRDLAGQIWDRAQEYRIYDMQIRGAMGDLDVLGAGAPAGGAQDSLMVPVQSSIPTGRMVPVRSAIPPPRPAETPGPEGRFSVLTGQRLPSLTPAAPDTAGMAGLRALQLGGLTPAAPDSGGAASMADLDAYFQAFQDSVRNAGR